MQRAAILPFPASQTPPYFSTLSHFRKNVREHKICVLISVQSNLVETFPIIRRNQRGTDINVKMSSCKVSLRLSGFNET